jgi:hypothetical protein
MKLNSEGNDDRRGGNCCSRRTRPRFPVIDCNFQAFSLDRYYGGSTGSSQPSFLNISREYFRSEARRNFLAEVLFFLAIAAILAATFVSDARAIIHFLHLPAA